MCEKCLNIRIKTPERRCCGVFIVNFEHISHLFLVFVLITSSICLFAEVYFYLRSENRDMRTKENQVFLCILPNDNQQWPLTVAINLG